jgi:hypothetical protein
MAESSNQTQLLPASQPAVEVVDVGESLSLPQKLSFPGSSGLLPTSLLHRRNGYERMPSNGEIGLMAIDTERQVALANGFSGGLDDVHGLGISAQGQRSPIPRVPVGSKRASPSTPASSHGPLNTPPSALATSPPMNMDSPEAKGKTMKINPWDAPQDSEMAMYERLGDDSHGMVSVPLAVDGAKTGARPLTRDFRTPSPRELGFSPEPEGNDVYDEASLIKKYGKHFSLHYQISDKKVLSLPEGEPPMYCSSRKDIHMSRLSWLSIIILVLSLYSTVMSGLWFTVALVQPRWGRGISTSAGILPSTATTITALLAKTIEMSFITVFISFVGQVLTRRSFIRKSRGVTLAEITMRNWVVVSLSHEDLLENRPAMLMDE